MRYSDGISVVIPNYNGYHLLDKNLPSLYSALENAKTPYEIIVFDDCSTDDSIAKLKKDHPIINTVSTPVNSGFATTCNTGIAESRKFFTCIVNTDVTFTDNYFKDAISHFDDPKVFAVKGDTMHYSEHYDDVFDINRDIVVYFKRGFIKFKSKDVFGKKKYDYVASLLGTCFMCRTELLKQIGGYDEVFSPYYQEDLDLAMTAIEKGYKVKYTPDCKVYHQKGSTISTTQPSFKKRIVAKRNRFILTWKHLNTTQRWMGHALFVLLSLVSRWLILDWEWYLAFASALKRYIIYRNRPRRLFI